MFFASKIRTRRFVVLKDVDEPDDEFIRPLLKHPSTFRSWRKAQRAADDGNAAGPSGTNWRSPTEKGRKNRTKRVLSIIGRAVGNVLIPDLRELQGDQCQKMKADLQLAYPPFMFSAGVFMFAF